MLSVAKKTVADNDPLSLSLGDVLHMASYQARNRRRGKNGMKRWWCIHRVSLKGFIYPRGRTNNYIHDVQKRKLHERYSLSYLIHKDQLVPISPSEIDPRLFIECSTEPTSLQGPQKPRSALECSGFGNLLVRIQQIWIAWQGLVSCPRGVTTLESTKLKK